jgi:hypothetical protein
VAVTCSYNDEFVLVWDTATGTVLRQLDMEEPGWIRPRRVAVSSCGDWFLCASTMEGDGKTFYLNLWGPSNQEFSASSRWGKNMIVCCVTINTSSQDLLSGAILCEYKEDKYGTYEWALLGSSDPEIIITPTAASEDVVSELIQASEGSQDLLLHGENDTQLHVRNAVLDGDVRCTCKASAVFDCEIAFKSAWSETTSAEPGDRASTSPKVAVGLKDGTVPEPGDRAHTSPKVAVGLRDGTVHFMELRNNNNYEKRRRRG